MKVLLAASFLLLAIANAHHTPEHNLRGPLFIPGKTHRYELFLNVSSGIPGLTSQLSKAVIKATVDIRPKTETEHLLKIENVKVSEVQSSVPSDEEYIPLRRASELERDLTKPIKFILRDGEIESYTLDKSESQESKRIKRSILRHLEVDLQDKGEVETHEWTGEYPYFYNTTKDTAFGPVTSWYTVSVDPYADFPYEQNVFNVSKGEIYETIGYPALHSHHNFAKQGCPEVCRLERYNMTNKYCAGCPWGYEPHHTPVKMYVTGHYNLRLLNGQMTLENMVVEEKHVASMYDQAMTVTIRAEYNLKELTDNNIEEPRDVREYNDLELDVEPKIKGSDIAEENNYLAMILPNLKGSDALSVVEEHLNNVVDTVITANLEGKESQLVGEKLILIQRAMTLFKRNHFENLWRNIPDIHNFNRAPEKEKVKRQIVLDLLPLVGTEECIEFIKYLIEQQKVSIWEAKEMLEAIPENMITPGERNIKNLYALLEMSHVKRQHLLHTAAHLCVARVVRKACVSSSFRNATETEDKIPDYRKSYSQLQQESPDMFEEETLSRLLRRGQSETNYSWKIKCPRRFVKTYVEELIEKLKKTPKIHEKVIYIETLAHIGSKKVLPALLPYVYGTAEEIQRYAPGDIDFLKTVTLYSLHHVIGYYPTEILRYVTPVYYNQTEPPRVRIAAFSLIIRCQPPLTLLQHIATDTWIETSNEVGSYVYTAVRAFANSSEPCMQLTARKLRHLLSEFKNYEIGYHHAQSMIKTFFDRLRNFGLTYRSAFIPSNESFIPFGVYGSVMYNIDNLKDDLIRFAINMQGISEDEILKLIDFEVLGMQWPRDIPDNKEREIFGSLNMIPRLPKHLRMTIYKKIFYSTTYAYISSETIMDVFEPLMEHLKNVYSSDRGVFGGNFVKVFIPASYHTFTIARTTAFPVEFYMKHPLLMSLKVESDMMSWKPHMKAKFYIRPSVYHTTYHAKHVMNPVDKKAYGVYFEQKFTFTYPFECYVHYNYENNTLIFRHKLPEMPKKIFRYHTECGSYAGDVKLHVLPSSLNREPITPPALFEKEKVIGIPALPQLYVVSHSEDMKEDMHEIPRNMEEIVALVMRYLRNPGWMTKRFNATLVQNPRKPIDSVFFMLTYNRTEKYPSKNMQQSFEAMPSSLDMDDESIDESNDLLQSMQRTEDDAEIGLKESEAKKLYKTLVTHLPHIAHELEVRMLTAPSYNNIKWRVEYNHTHDRLLHTLMASTMMKMEKRQTPYEACYTHVMKYSHIPNEFEYKNWRYATQRADFYCSANLRECKLFGNPDLTVKGSYLHVPSEELFDKDEFATPIKKEWFLPETHEECLEDARNGNPMSVACMRAIRDESNFNRLKVKFQWYNELPEMLRNVTDKLDQAIKYAWYSNADINRINVNNPDKTVKLSIDYVDKLTNVPVFNIHMKTPNENVHYHKINAKYMKPLSVLYNFKDNVLNHVTNNTYPSTCTLMEKYVQTFDLKNFELPDDKCTYVLSTHCVERKKYVVLAKNIATSKKEVIIYVGEHKIVLKPSQREDVYPVKYDGQEYTVKKDMPVTFHEEEQIHAYVIPHISARSGQNSYVLVFHAHNVGIWLHYDGKNVKLQVHPFYKGQVCGLCSEFDGEITREYRGVDQCLYSHHKDFAHSAVIDKEQCGVNRPQYPVLCPHRRNRKSVFASSPFEEEDSDSDSELFTPGQRGSRTPRLMTIHMQHGNTICFSTKPVPKCTEDEEPIETEIRTVEFHCLPKYEATTRYLLAESERRILTEIANKSVDHVATLSVPKTCSQ